MSKVLVTGGNGFLGRHIVPTLVAAGHVVRTIDRCPSESIGRLEIECMQGDLSEEATVKQALVGMEVVVHLACTTVPQSSEEQRIYDVHSNVEMALLLLECAVKSGVRRFIFASSGGTVYGEPRHLPISEDHPTNPICSHGVMKLAIENYLEVIHRLTGLETIALRMANPYGQGQGLKPQGFIGVVARRVREGSPIELWGDGGVVRDFLHVGDAAAAFALVVGGRGSQGAYNIGTSRGRSLLEVIAAIEEILGRSVPLMRVSGRAFDVAANVLDISKARRDLGWEPKMTLEEGLRDLFSV
jgi:UDP-glucose 4-epimerase